MVGGGSGAGIGSTHRHALRLDGRYELVAGVFGRDPSASAALAAELSVAADRVYADHREMAEREAARPDGVELVVVATPNDSHAEVAGAFLEHGIPVVCEKPLTPDVTSSLALVDLAARTGTLLAVPHCYSAYAMVREAARLVRDGRLGRLTYVDVEHASGWAAAPLERGDHKQAAWRTDPGVSGRLSVVGDLGTHAFHLLRYVTGLEVTRVSAQLRTLVPGRRVFDHATATLELTGGVPARAWASMAATGHHHGLRIRVYGDQASLEWRHEDPQHLVVRELAGATVTLTQGMGTLSEDARRVTRVGLGHPEGFLEAFATFYSDLAEALQARRAGGTWAPRELSIPTGVDGLVGVSLVEAVGSSHRQGGAWVDVSVPRVGRDQP